MNGTFLLFRSGIYFTVCTVYCIFKERKTAGTTVQGALQKNSLLRSVTCKVYNVCFDDETVECMLLCLVCILQRVLNFNTNNANIIHIFIYTVERRKLELKKCLLLLEHTFKKMIEVYRER
jgi:hypothetical protein